MEINYRAGEILKKQRISLGYTQEHMSVELGMSIHQYQRYEYDQHSIANCPMKIGLRICHILRIDPYELVFPDDDMCIINKKIQ